MIVKFNKHYCGIIICYNFRIFFTILYICGLTANFNTKIRELHFLNSFFLYCQFLSIQNKKIDLKSTFKNTPFNNQQVSDTLPATNNCIGNQRVGSYHSKLSHIFHFRTCYQVLLGTNQKSGLQQVPRPETSSYHGCQGFRRCQG